MLRVYDDNKNEWHNTETKTTCDLMCHLLKQHQSGNSVPRALLHPQNVPVFFAGFIAQCPQLLRKQKFKQLNQRLRTATPVVVCPDFTILHCRAGGDLIPKLPALAARPAAVGPEQLLGGMQTTVLGNT